MEPMCYIGLDVRKRTISYCVKDGSGTRRRHDTRQTLRSGSPNENTSWTRCRGPESYAHASVMYSMGQEPESERASPETSELAACSLLVVTLLDVRGVVFF